MNLLDEFQLQAIRDLKNAVQELLDDMDGSAFDVQDIETLVDDVNQAWEHVKAQLTKEEQG